jgi:hypothetical protein
VLIPSELVAACSTTSSSTTGGSFRVFDGHEARVLEDATARLIPRSARRLSEVATALRQAAGWVGTD